MGVIYHIHFYSSRRPSQIGPTADFDSVAIPPPIFSMGPVPTSLYAPTVLLVVIDYQTARRREVSLASMTRKPFLFDIQKN